MEKVYIIILNYQKWKDTSECILSLMRSGYQNFTVVIIDNDSQNNSLEHIISELSTCSSTYNTGSIHRFENLKEINFDDKLVFIQNPGNNGFAAGINPVLSILSPRDGYIWLLNPDTVVDQDTLEELVKFKSSNSARTIVGAAVYNYNDDSRKFVYGGGSINFSSGTISNILSSDQKDRIDFISGTCLFTSCRSFRELGLLPEDYFLYWEETEWCYKAKKSGYKLEVCPTAICYDKGSTSIGKSFLADYYYTRNGLRFISKFSRAYLPLAITSVFMRAGKRVLKGELKRANGVLSGMKDFLKQF